MLQPGREILVRQKGTRMCFGLSVTATFFDNDQTYLNFFKIQPSRLLQLIPSGFKFSNSCAGSTLQI